MSFLFKSKKQQASALPAATRDTTTSPQAQAPSSAIPTTNAPRAAHQSHGSGSQAAHTPTPASSVNNSVGSLPPAAATASPKQEVHRDRANSESQNNVRPAPAPAPRAAPPAAPSAAPPADSPYPWSQRRLAFTTAANPFPRYGAAVNCSASKEGMVYLMGGLVNGATVKGDLWMVEAGSGNMACYPVATASEGPGPRVGHASLLVGNAFIVFGGDTKVNEGDILDDTLYLLNTSTKQWSRALPAGPRPSGRYGHTLNILGSKIFVFGGQVEGYFFNDLVAFDLNALQQPNNRWEILTPNSADVNAPPGQYPPARTNHTVIAWQDKLFLFGGTDGQTWFSDVWCYDPKANRWEEIDCIGYIPIAREGHAAAIVNDTMYVFGGRTKEGTDLGDLAAFRISSRRWYMFQNMGPSPSPRSGHSMTAFGRHIVVLAGEPSSTAPDRNELSLAYILDTSKIRYPASEPGMMSPPPGAGVMSPPPGAGAPTGRKVSGGSGIPTRIGRESVSGGPPSRLPGPPGAQPPNGPPGSRMPRAAVGTTVSSGPPPQQQAPEPRVNGPSPGPGPINTRSRTPEKSLRGYGSPVDTARAAAFDRGNLSPVPRDSPTREIEPTSIAARALREQSPVNGGARSPAQQRMAHQHKESGESLRQPPPRAESRTARQKPSQDQIDHSVTRRPSAEHQRAMSRDQERVEHQRAMSRDQERVEHQRAMSRDQERVEHQRAMSRDHDRAEHQRAMSRDQERVQIDSALSSTPVPKHLNDEVVRELEAAKSRNAWLASELALARKAGYQPNASNNPILDEKAAEAFGDDDRPLVEALIKMRAELAKIQGSIEEQAESFGRQVAEVEKQRDAAINEAVYAKTKLAAHGGSQAGTPQPDGGRGTVTPDQDRMQDMNRRLASSLAAQSQLSTRVDTLLAEIEAEKKARKLAEETADAAQKRASELDSYRQRTMMEMESLRGELHEAEKVAREESATSAEAQASARMLTVDKTSLSGKLAQALEDAKNHSVVLQSLHDAVTASTDKASLFESKLEEERSHRSELEERLAQLKVEHEESIRELETTARRLKDVEELADKHAAEANMHRQAVLSGLSQVAARSGEDDEVNNERIQILQEQVESANAMVRKNQEAADTASEKLRRAEERIAGLETFQEQASREGLSIRKQLQSTMRELQAVQSDKSEVQQEYERHRLESNALEVQLKTLKSLLEERGISVAEHRRSRVLESPSSRFSTPELNRVRELEQQLEASLKAHDEMRSTFENREQEISKDWEEKITALHNDHQAAVKYLRGTEKMLSKMKQELERYKILNNDLQQQLEATKSDPSVTEQSANWETERQTLRDELTNAKQTLQSTVSQLESQISTLKSDLATARQEQEAAAHRIQQLEAEAAAGRADMETLRQERTMLEERVNEAEQRAQMFLDQFENSVDSLRREATMPAEHGAGAANNTHHRSHNSIAGDSIYSQATDVTDRSATPEANPDAVAAAAATRNSMALDSLATELDALRSHWETTNKAYRLSNQFDFEPTPTSIKGNEMSESLAHWRQRMDLGDEDDDDDEDLRHPTPLATGSNGAGVQHNKGHERMASAESDNVKTPTMGTVNGFQFQSPKSPTGPGGTAMI